MSDAPIALVTGAASGLGAAFARLLAAEGFRLILVDKSRERLETFASDLVSGTSVPKGTNHSPTLFVADLADASQTAELARKIAEGPTIDLLVNNAGFGTTGRFAEIDLQKQLDMLHVHSAAPMYLCRAVLPSMIAAGKGKIINVCSINAFTRFPETVTYAATKSFLLVFSETLHTELTGTGVRVLALCPGQTRTEFNSTPEMKAFNPNRIPGFLWMSADQVARAAYRAINRGASTYVPALKNKMLVLVFGSRAGRIALAIYRKIRESLRGVPLLKNLP